MAEIGAMVLIAIVVFLIAIDAGAASKRRRVSYGSHYESHRNWDDDDEDYERESHRRERDYERQRRREENEARRQQKVWTDSLQDSADYANNFFGGGKRRSWGF